MFTRILIALVGLAALLATPVQGGTPAPQPAAVPPGPIITGGWSTISPTSQQVQQVAQFAVTELTNVTNSWFVLVLLQVISAQAQVVAGFNYALTLRIGTTSSIVGWPPSPCQRIIAIQQCNVAVLQQSWLNPPMKLTGYSCTPAFPLY